MDQHLLNLRKVFSSVARGKHDYVKQLQDLTNKDKHPLVINDLAESFHTMLEKLEAKELQLQEALKQGESPGKELRALQIQINQVKKHEEVLKVTDSWFFKEMQKRKAEHMKKS